MDRKSKRPGAVHVPKFPTVAQIPQWEKAVARALVAPSVYDDKAEVKWFKRTSRKGVTFEDLGDVGEERFHALDALLCQALIKNLSMTSTSEFGARRMRRGRMTPQSPACRWRG